METPPPPIFNKSQINEFELINKIEIKSYLTFNDINYVLEMGFNKEKTEIVFVIEEEGRLSIEFYYYKMNLESAQKLSKFFLACDSFDQVMETLKYLHKKINKNNKSKKEYKIDFILKDNKAILKYKIPFYTGENLYLEIALQKKEKSKDSIIEKLKERIKELEEGYFEIKKKDENKNQNLIHETFKNIRNKLNQKETELIKKYGVQEKNTEYDQLKIVLKKEIENILFERYTFKWNNGSNYTLDDNKLVAEKTSGGNSWNCSILGDKPLPKNSVVSWKIKIKKFKLNSSNSWNILIGVAPDNLAQKEENLYNNCWTFICGCSQLSIKSGSETKYKTGKLKANDVVEVKMDTSKGNLSFAVNENDYGIACNITQKENLYPIVMIYDEGNSIELIQ